jgi:hypothetical protein
MPATQGGEFVREAATGEEGGVMATARIEAAEARQRVQSGEALLVCAYDKESKCDTMKLEGAISLGAFEANTPSLPKNLEA